MLPFVDEISVYCQKILEEDARVFTVDMLCDQNALHLKTPFEHHIP
jgi:hypothetical protein